MAKFVNLCPHAINTNDGREFPPSGTVARVAQTFTEFDADGVCCQVFGAVEGLPEPEQGTVYIVSLVVLSALAGARADVVAPATGHPAARRSEKGQIVSVPGFVR